MSRMEFAGFTCIIWSLLVVGRSLGDEMADRVLTLETKVEKLESESVQRSELIHLLMSGAAELKGEKSNDTNTSDGEDGRLDQTLSEKSPPAPVTDLEVRQEILDSWVKFTVTYRPVVDDVVVKWQDYRMGRFKVDSSDKALENGTRETSALVKGREDSGFSVGTMVSFTAERRNTLELYLNGDGGNVTNIPIPVLYIEPSDLVYEDGEDVVFEVTTAPLPEEASSVLSLSSVSLYLESYLIDPQTGNVLTNFENLRHLSPQGNLELIDNNTFPDHEVMKFKLTTSNFKTSGFINFKASAVLDTPDSNSTVMTGITLNKLVVIRPPTQDGPFPPGYIKFIKQDWQEYDSNGAVPVYCGPEYCSFSCTAVGDDIETVEIVRTEPDGTNTSVKHLDGFDNREETYDIDNDYIRWVEVEFKKDSRTTERFSCLATSGDGQIATQDVTVEYYLPQSIVQEDSGIQIEQEGSGLMKLKLICRIKGYPLPNVTFTVSTYDYYYQGGSLPDEVTDLGNDEFEVIKYLTYDPEDPYNYSGQSDGKPHSASCTAETTHPLSYDYYSYSIDFD